MLGSGSHMSITSPRQDSVRGTVLAASILAVFLLRFVGEGLSPCPHHASLQTSGHAPASVFAESLQGGAPDGHGTTAGSQSESEGHEGSCSCLKACSTESGESIPSGQFQNPRPFFTAVQVAEGLFQNLFDTRQNGYLVLLPQPPPHSS